jgi:hypothetical protein
VLTGHPSCPRERRRVRPEFSIDRPFSGHFVRSNAAEVQSLETRVSLLFLSFPNGSLAGQSPWTSRTCLGNKVEERQTMVFV